MSSRAAAQPDVTTTRTGNELPALGIRLEEYGYPHPVGFLPVQNDLQQLAMAYMDAPPTAEPNGTTVVMFHGGSDRAARPGRSFNAEIGER